MVEYECRIIVNSPSETVFSLIADLAGYSIWLPGSETFAGAKPASPSRPGVGTAYVDHIRAVFITVGLPGKITVYEPPTHIRFEERTPFKIPVYEARVDYIFEPLQEGTNVQRKVRIDLHGLFNLAAPLVRSKATTEGDRIVKALKLYLEGPSSPIHRS